MEFKHTTVLLEETVEALNIKENGIYVDGTLGGGGHASLICKNLNEEGILIGIDRDVDALYAAEQSLKDYPCKKHFVQDNYANIKEILNLLGLDKIDGALLDLGVSSFQLDNPDRGFSYMQDAPLDMRMDRSKGITAEEIVNHYPEKELYRIIRDYGEERWASRIVQFITRERSKQPISTTTELVRIIKAAIPASARREGPHPAKRTFQAIRIEVNDELGQLKKATTAFVDVLDKQGRLAIITFHSLEDRIVKETFQYELNPCNCPKDLPLCVCGKEPRIIKINNKPILPSHEELDRNPRARSAKLRIIEKC